MKKILIFLLMFYGHSFALESESTIRLYEHIFAALSRSHPIAVYVEDPEYREVFLNAKSIVLAKDVGSADVVLVTKRAMLEKVLHLKRKKGAVLFATSYRMLEDSKEVIGASYWKKGRVQLLFVAERLKAHGIVLPDEYEKFTVDEL